MTLIIWIAQLMNKKKQLEVIQSPMKGGYRVRLWKSNRDECSCMETEIYVVCPGTRE